MKKLIFHAAAINEFASPARMTASFELSLEDDVYEALAAKAPGKSRFLQEIELLDFENVLFNNNKWSLGNELQTRAERTLVDKYRDVFLRKEISWITDVYEISVYWPREITYNKK